MAYFILLMLQTAAMIITQAFRGVIMTVRLSAVHVALIIAVVIYLLIGAYAYHRIEGDLERQSIVDYNTRRQMALAAVQDNAQEFTRFALETNDTSDTWVLVRKLSDFLNESLVGHSEFQFTSDEVIFTTADWGKTQENEAQIFLENWSFGSSLLFAFTAISTIGYGNIAPATDGGRVFTIFYALIGIPLFLLVIADLGKFILVAVKWIADKCKNLLLKKLKFFQRRKQDEILNEKDDEEKEEEAGGPFLLVVFVVYIIIGAALCPIWEKPWTFFDGIYFSFVTLTTIGFGDIYPKNHGMLLPTLIYITIGLALTTMAIEIAGSLFKKLHYLGAKLKNVKSTTVWFGGKQLTVQELAVAVGKKYGIPEEEMDNLDFDELVEEAIIQKEEGPKEPLMEVVVTEMEPLLKEPQEEEAEQDFWFELMSGNECAAGVLPVVLFERAEFRACSAKQEQVEAVGCFDIPAEQLSAVITLKDFLVERISCDFYAAEEDRVACFGCFDLPAADQFESITFPEIVIEQVDLALEAVKPKASTVASAVKLLSSVPDNYKRSLSASLGLKLPTAAERAELALPKPIKPSNGTANLNQFPFVLISTKSVTQAKLPHKCKTCLVAFPIPRKGIKEQGPRNMAVVHWEYTERDKPPFSPGRKLSTTLEVSGDRKLSTPSASPKLSKSSIFDDTLELRPVLVHPWYQCLTNRYPNFSLQKLQMDPVMRSEFDKKHGQLLVEQLGITDPDSIQVISSDWRENPENSIPSN